MTIRSQYAFLSSESGAVIVEWTTLAAAVIGFGIASVAAVQTGLISLGGKSGSSIQTTAVAYVDSVATGGPSVQLNTGKDNIYKPLATDKDKYQMYIYELAGRSHDELASLYLTYMAEADKFLAAGDKESAAQHLDVAAAAASVMKDYKYEIPDSDQKLSQYYGQIAKK